jgi:hypothetical protein
MSTDACNDTGLGGNLTQAGTSIPLAISWKYFVSPAAQCERVVLSRGPESHSTTVVQASGITTVEAGSNVVDTCFVSRALVAYTDRTYGTLSNWGRIKWIRWSLHTAQFEYRLLGCRGVVYGFHRSETRLYAASLGNKGPLFHLSSLFSKGGKEGPWFLCKQMQLYLPVVLSTHQQY